MPVTITNENILTGIDGRISILQEGGRTGADAGRYAYRGAVEIAPVGDTDSLADKLAECLAKAVGGGCESVFVDASGRGAGVPSEMVYRAVVAAAEELPCYGDVYVSYYSGDGAMELLEDGLLPGDDDLAIKDTGEAQQADPMHETFIDGLFSGNGNILFCLNRRQAGMPVRASDIAPVREDGPFEVSETFSAAVLRLIDEKGMTEVECYKRANVDRRVFSKIKCDPKYMPSKSTATAFAVALGLSVDEANDLLGKAGYTLSRSLLSDVIVIWFLEHGEYDVYRLNIILYNNGEQPIGFKG